MYEDRWKVIIFLFLLIIPMSFAAEDEATIVRFRIPGVEWYYVPVINSTPVFSSTGNHTINYTVFLRNTDTGVRDLNNSGTMTGNITFPNGTLSNVSFINSNSNGLYNVTFDYTTTGTYLLKLHVENESYGWSETQTYISVGAEYVLLDLTTNSGSYNSGDSAVISLTAEDGDGNPESGAVTSYRILYPNNFTWINWSSMTDQGNGLYLAAVVIPTTVGTYFVEANYSKGSVLKNTNTTFQVTLGGGGGGGGGGSTGTPYYDVEVRTDGYFFKSDELIKATIVIINKGDYPDRDAFLNYNLIGPDGEEYEGVMQVFEEIPVGASLYDVSLPLPPKSRSGQWLFYVSYETVNQPILIAQDTFIVNNYIQQAFFWVLLVIGIILIYLSTKKKVTVAWRVQ